MNVGEYDASTIAVFIPFQREAYTSSTAGRVMLRAISVMFGIVQVRCGNFENKTVAIIGNTLTNNVMRNLCHHG